MEYLQFISILIVCTLLLGIMVFSLALVLFPVIRKHKPEYELSKAEVSKIMLTKEEDVL
ncbi:MAG: hypothetical protein JJU28_15230 [Cyclobacteriaceae bacterium]|nr:hypothetical protein [Cyclobacteriaceae bacterium]